MIDKTLINELSSEMKQILNAEIEAGNEIIETSLGGFSETSNNHIFVFLRYPFKGQYDISGICYREINDPHYWKAEYDDDINHQTIARNYGIW